MSPKNNPRRRPQVLSPKERNTFVKEYREATSWGGKKTICERYNISEGQATHLVEEHILGDKKRSWGSYTPTQQAQIMQEYVDAPEGGKREVAFTYGLMTRAVSAGISRAKEKGEAPEPEFRPLHPIKNPPSQRDYEKSRRPSVSFAQGDPEIHTRPRQARMTQDPGISRTPPGAGDAMDEVVELLREGKISKDLFLALIDKLNK